MSHFTVMVIDTTGKRDLAEHLQPWHEYECTGTKDQYVKRVISEDYQVEEYLQATVSVVVVKETGEYYCDKYGRSDKSERFWKRTSKFGGISSGDEFILPEGYEEKEMPVSERYTTHEEYLKDYCGIDLAEGKYYEMGDDGKVYRYTNPNAKWDWWQVGGRWSGFLTLVDGNQSDDNVFGNIAWNTMLDQPKKEAGELFDKLAAAIGLDSEGRLKQPSPTWPELRKLHKGNPQAAREAYQSDPVKVAFEEVRSGDTEHKVFGFFSDVTDFSGTREEYITRRSEQNISTYAVLKDGQWFSKGEMGWFGMSSESDDESKAWNTSFQDTFLKDLPPEARVTIVDCHI